MSDAKHPADAEPVLTAVTELDPSNPEALVRLGSAKLALGKRAEGIELFRRALRLAPGYDMAQKALSAALGG
jgi:cytochrome c-type biogenesis protein CcmH/NrfG